MGILKYNDNKMRVLTPLFLLNTLAYKLLRVYQFLREIQVIHLIQDDTADILELKRIGRL
ncbi:MAG: hypothetical protein JWP94_1977 [Mucilaginibacter sp.]|nr:hypothetical protein [Mucilaginibacter sp.]